MAKRTYALTKGAGIFYDEETNLKVLPGKKVQIDKDDCGTRTRIAIQNNHLVEVVAEEKPASPAQNQQK